MDNKKLFSNSNIQTDTILIKEFLFIFINGLYKKFKDKTISLINNSKITTNQIGNFILDPDKLTQQELVEIIFNTIANLPKIMKNHIVTFILFLTWL